MKNTVLIALLSLSGALVTTAQTGTFTEHHTLQCGDTLVIGGLGYPTWNDPHIIQPAQVGNAVLIGDFVPPNILVYIAPPYFQGSDTVMIECAHATQISCDTGIYIFNISCDTAAASTIVSEVPCGDTVTFENLSGWWLPYLSEQALNGTGEVWLGPTDGALVLYYPNAGFEGTDWLVIESANGAFEPILLIFHVRCQTSGLQQTDNKEAFRVWPNPARETLYLEGSGLENKYIEIRDATGRLALRTKADKNALTLDISALPPDLYFVGLRHGQVLQSIRKLVIR